MNVAVQERAHVLIRRRNFMLIQYADNDTGIGHPSDFDVAQIVIDSEALFEG